MSHEITIGDASVTFEEVEIDLDYAEIQENLDFSDYVEYADLADRIEENLPDIAEECSDQAKVLLHSFTNAESPCSLGHEFIQAVQKAMTWQGDRYVEPAFTNNETRTDLKHQVRAVLADMLLGTRNVNGETTHEIGNH